MPRVASSRTSSKVLVVPRAAVAELFAAPRFFCDRGAVNRVVAAIKSKGLFVDRASAETNPAVKQIVAFGVIRSGKRLLCVRRAARSNRATLRLRYTVLFGGHVDDHESRSSDPARDCLVRELKEELGVRPSRAPNLIGVVADPTTAVGQLHLGLVFDVRIDRNVLEVSPSLDQSEFVNTGRRNQYRLRPLEAFIHKRFDAWSNLFLASGAAQRLLGAKRALPSEPKPRS